MTASRSIADAPDPAAAAGGCGRALGLGVADLRPDCPRLGACLRRLPGYHRRENPTAVPASSAIGARSGPAARDGATSHPDEVERGDPTARILAVLALVVAAIVVVVVIAGSIGGSGRRVRRRTRRQAGRPSAAARSTTWSSRATRSAAIAAEEGVPVARLEELNPNLDTQLLPEKGCVNLVPEGCKELANGG